jgi:hypothetical protein
MNAIEHASFAIDMYQCSLVLLSKLKEAFSMLLTNMCYIELTKYQAPNPPSG